MTTRAVTLSLLLFAAACSSDGDDPAAPDAACTTQFFADSDGDGFGDSSMQSCDQLPGYVTKGGDCRDNDAAAHPLAGEICDQKDNNCDGKIDDADPMVNTSLGSTFYLDGDGDGFGTPTMMKRACAAPAGYVASSTDCNDALATINPTASEVCDQIDNDCDALVDIADPSLDLTTAKSFYRDFDNDTYGAGTPMVACTAPSGYVLLTGDCNDMDNTSKPGGIEICDGADNNCDGGIDGTVAAPNQCAALVGTYTGSYTHLAQEKIGMTVVNSMQCSGTGSGSLLLNRKPALQGTFTCVYNGGLGLFQQNQKVTIAASVALNGSVTGTVEHTYDTFSLKRTYNVTGTQTGTTLTLSGMGSLLPHPMATVPWVVTFSFAATK